MNFLTKQRNIPIGRNAGGVLGILLFAVIVLTWGYVFFGSSGPATQPQKAHTPDAVEVYVQAQQFVKQGLKAPSTAQFPLEPVRVGTDGNGLYQVESYVDSQNGFGAMIRSHWMLNMRPVGDKWMLETMQIDGKIVYDITNDN